jgi:5-methylcytosine-specific restriction endonuclease McrA
MPSRPPIFGANRKVHPAALRPRERRESACKRGYDRQWRENVRKPFLVANPLCVLCMNAGRVVPAEHVDHKVAKAKGGGDEWDNLQPLCASCHSRKTAREDGAFGRNATCTTKVLNTTKRRTTP